jgi:hypothetical protein
LSESPVSCAPSRSANESARGACRMFGATRALDASACAPLPRAPAQDDARERPGRHRAGARLPTRTERPSTYIRARPLRDRPPSTDRETLAARHRPREPGPAHERPAPDGLPASRGLAEARARLLRCWSVAVSRSVFPVSTRVSVRPRTLARAITREGVTAGAGAITSAVNQARRSPYRMLTPRPLPSRCAASLPDRYARRTVRTLRRARCAASATVSTSSSW